ncbi:LacI family DNA-binding transcriptional regulator [Companilactobacillus sp. HBUAS56257]|uniref:LacI family DNA-binding transcriptional regulator n=1 Tax=Companilactobacillus sp. HBUAS56257 TaxID=3109360 RepID=UPI002FF283BC
MKANKTTIKDVALKAGISVTAVSLILNGKGERFSSETKRKVHQAQLDLDYYPDYYARGLVGQRNNSLGIVIPNIKNPFFSCLALSIEQAAIPKGYFPQIFSVNGFKENIDYFIEQFASGTQKGLILAAPGASKEIVDKLSLHNEIPMVLTDQADLSTDDDRVLIAEEKSGKEIANYLISLNHRRIAFVIPKKLTMNLVKRFTGYTQAFVEHGLEVSEDLIFRTDFNPEGGVKAAKEIVKTDATAIIAINDDVAMGIYKGLNLLGKTVPGDYSVVGFDDFNLNKYLIPSLTTMAQPIDLIGQKVVDLLIERIKYPNRPSKKIVLDTKLKIGDSTRKLNEGGRVL